MPNKCRTPPERIVRLKYNIRLRRYTNRLRVKDIVKPLHIGHIRRKRVILHREDILPKGIPPMEVAAEGILFKWALNSNSLLRDRIPLNTLVNPRPILITWQGEGQGEDDLKLTPRRG